MFIIMSLQSKRKTGASNKMKTLKSPGGAFTFVWSVKNVIYLPCTCHNSHQIPVNRGDTTAY